MVLSPATYKVLYDNVNITKDISDHLVSLSYADKVEGESDELEITLEDSDLLWQNAWYPKKGARLEASIELDGLVLNCGAFTIDEIELQSDRGSGDKITLRALAATIVKNIRTKQSSGHENKTLREIATTIAAANGLQVAGTIADITFQRITQYNETDLSFLKRLSQDYGYVFSVRDTTITFTNIFDLETRPHIMSIDKTDLLSYSYKDKTAETYKTVTVKYHSIDTNETVEDSINEEDDDPESEDDTSTTQAPATLNDTALNDLQTNIISRVLIPALSKRDKKYLATLPTLISTRITNDVKTITSSAHDQQLSSLGNTIYQQMPGFNNACANGDFNTVNSFGTLLNQYITYAHRLSSGKTHSNVKGDTYNLKTRAENKQQAEAKAKAVLHKKNSQECAGSFSMPGNVLIVAGVNVELTGMGTLSGIIHVTESTHSIDQGGGYVTSADFKKVAAIDTSKYKPKTTKSRSTSKKIITVEGNSNDYGLVLINGQPAANPFVTQ